MAGSYNHVVKEDGNLESNQVIADMLENGGDVFEAVEEMYGMIWYLAFRGFEMDAGRVVEEARQNYQEGLRIAKRSLKIAKEVNGS